MSNTWLISNYGDILRSWEVLLENNAEMRASYLVDSVTRRQRETDQAIRINAELEARLENAKKVLNFERQLRFQAERERDIAKKKLQDMTASLISRQNRLSDIQSSDYLSCGDVMSIESMGETEAVQVEQSNDVVTEAGESPPRRPERNPMPVASAPSQMHDDDIEYQNIIYSSIFTSKRHQFTTTKTLSVKSNSCTHCGKRILFSSNCLNCRDCRAVLHLRCRNLYTMNCIPNMARTPTINATISDHVPNTPPYIPALVVRCVHEIEARGLQEEGLYRLCGSDLLVKQLKEAFLRGKTLPPVSSTDIHVLCGCIKEFLKSLQDTLIPNEMWFTFSNAAQSDCPVSGLQQMRAAVRRMPKANRDTLAFLMQHFQRIAQCPSTKMPLENIAKVFAPTIVGYSHKELEANAVFAETVINVAVMQGLLRIPTKFWTRFVNIEREQPNENVSTTEEQPSARSVPALVASTPAFRLRMGMKRSKSLPR